MDKTDCGADKQNNCRRIRRRKKPGQQEDCSDSASAQIITNNDTGNFAGLDKKELLVELENHRIFELERRDPSFQRAKFFCQLCEVLLKSSQDCVQHLHDGRHQRKQDPWAESVSEISSMINYIELPASYKVYDQIRRVEHMPEPSRQHVTALDTVVERVCQQHGLSSAQLLLRQDTTSRLRKFLSAFRDGMTLHLYGSSLTGFGLTDSDVDISVAGSGLPSKLLLDAFNTLYQHGGDQYEEVHSDFNSTIPKVLVTDTKSGLQLRLTANTGPSVLTSKLLRIYSLADPRVTPLTIAFRCWAKMCQLDMPEEGSLPAVAFSIMVVYFLQQVEPSVLPVMPLPEPQPEGKGTIPMKMEDRVDFQALKSQVLAWQSDNRCSVGDLWLQLLKFYCLHFDYAHVVVSLRYAKVLTRLEKKWHAKKFTVEDPFSVKRSISSTMSSFRMFEYYQSCLLTACEYFAVPRDFEAKTSSVHPVQLQTNQSAHSVLTDSRDASSMDTNTYSEADRDSQNGQAIHGKAHGVQKRETVCEKMHRTETDKRDEKGVNQHGQERADVMFRGQETTQDVSDKRQDTADDVSDEGQKRAEIGKDKEQESAEHLEEIAADVSDKGQEGAEDVSDKGLESAERLEEILEDVNDKELGSAEDVSDKGQESAEDVSDKGQDSAEDVSDKGQESAEDVSDKGQESAEDVNEKGLESAEDVESAGDVSDKGLESDKEQQSAGDVSDKEQESAGDVSDKEQESAGDVSDKEQESATDVSDKGQESAADVSDKGQESAADVNDKEQESAADVSDKEQESARVSDKGQESAGDVSDKGQESAADVNDKEEESAADVSDKEQESADVSDKGQESAADVNDKGQESAADVNDKGQDSAADVSDKEQESADVSDRRHEGAEDVSDKEQEGEEDVSDGKQESAEDVSDGTQEVATDVSDKGLKNADVIDKGQEGAEDVSDRKQESAADVSDGAQEIAADVSDKGLKIAGDPSDKEQESAADVSDKRREGTADVSVEGKESAVDVSDNEQEQANVNDKGLVSVAVSNKEQEMTGSTNDKGQERKDVSNKDQENSDVSDKEPENADVSDREQERIEDVRVSAQTSGGIILAAEQKRAEGVGMVEQSPEQCVLTTVCSGIAPCVRNEVLDSSFTAGTQAESPKVVKQTEEHLLLEEQNRQDLLVSQAEDDQKSTFVYKFTREVFTKGKGPVVMCVSCGKEGHIKTKCPADKAVPLEPLPPMTESHMVLLDTVVSAIVDDFGPDDTQKKQRQMIVGDIEYYLQRFFPGVSLSLFGSSCNGFGFASSDLDICMTFRGKNIQDVKVKQVMYKLAWALKEAASLCREVVCIPHAKVPIVKFTHSVTGLQGDISLFNTLAIRNTHLLRCYSDLDLRVMKLGYAIKVFAKVCNIGDKSKGSLSSYAYIVMMLHYLQQVSPPVIPVLQEMYQGERPQHMVEGWNTWFYENLKKMREVWPDYGKNTQSVGELWLGFFRYYVEHFDWKGTVVTIRQKAVLTKFEKMWTGKAIVVEDPFDLNHNLAVGLSQSMNDFIFKAFVNARTHFGTPVELRRELFSLFNSPADYFFEELLLKRGVSCLSKVRRKLKGAAKTPKEKTLKKEKPGKGQDDGSMVQDASSPAGQDSPCPESQDVSSVAGQDADSLASQNSHSPAGQGADSLAEQGPDSPVGQVADSPAGQCPHLPTGQSADSPAGQGAHSPYGQGADRPVGQSTTNHIIQSQVFFNRTSSVPHIDPDLTSEDAQNRGTLTDDAGTLTSTSLTGDLDTQTAIGLTDDRDTLTATAMTAKSPMSLEEVNPTLLEGMTPEELVLTPQVQMAMFGSPLPGMESASSATLLSGRQSISETHLQSVSAMSSLLSQLPPSTSHSGMHDPEHTLFPHGQPVYPSASTQACVSAHSQPGRPLPSALAAVHHTGAGGCQKETPPPGSPTTGHLQQQQLKYGARRGKRREKQNFQHCQKQAMNASNTAVSKKGPTLKPASESPVPVAPVRGNPAPLKSRTDSTRSKQPDRGNTVSLKSRTDSARSKQPDRGNPAPLKSHTDSARSKQPDRGNPVSLKSPADGARSKQPDRGNPVSLKSPTDSARSKQRDRGNPVSLKSPADSARSKQPDRENPVSLKLPTDSARSKQRDRGNPVSLKSPADSARSKQPDRGNPVSLKSPTDSARSKRVRGNPVSLKSRADSARSKEPDRGNPVSLKSPTDSAHSKRPDRGNPVSLKSPTDCALSKQPDRGNPVSLKSPTDSARSKQPGKGDLVL